MNGLGVSGSEVVIDGDNLVITVPGNDSSEARNLGQTARLYIRPVIYVMPAQEPGPPQAGQAPGEAPPTGPPPGEPLPAEAPPGAPPPGGADRGTAAGTAAAPVSAAAAAHPRPAHPGPGADAGRTDPTGGTQGAC